MAAELCRRGLLATPFAGNVPHYDIVASGQHGGHALIQVKAINSGGWQLDLSRFVEITFEDTPLGTRQLIGCALSEPCKGLVYVLVHLDKDMSDRFFVLTWEQLQRLVTSHHRLYLKKHNGIRPKAPRSLHVTLSVAEISDYEDRWDTILEVMG